jgi:hypothetical protein
VNPELGLPLTHHARVRMDSRRISLKAVEVVLAHGREAYVRGARVYALGHKEVALAFRKGLDLRPFEGVQVVCSHDGDVMQSPRTGTSQPWRYAGDGKMIGQLQSGRWCGWWRQGLHEGHEVLGLTVEGVAIAGGGHDEGGAFTLAGHIHPDGLTTLTKHYTLPLTARPTKITCRGQWNGRLIRGSWADDRSPAADQGPFLLWPSQDVQIPPVSNSDFAPCRTQTDLDLQALIHPAFSKPSGASGTSRQKR